MGSSNDLQIEDMEAAVMAEDTTVQLLNIDEENMKGSGSEITEPTTSDSTSLENINDDATTTSQSQSSSTSATSSSPLKVDDDTSNNTMEIVDKENTRNNQSPTRQEGGRTTDTDTDTTDSDSMMSIMDDRSTDKSPSTKDIITEPQQQQQQPLDMEVEVEEKSSKKVKYSNDAEKKEEVKTTNLSSAPKAIQIIDNDKSEKEVVEVVEERKMEEDVMRSKMDALTEKKLGGEDLDSALDALREVRVIL